MKIKMVKFYQSVRFKGTEWTSVMSPEFKPMRVDDSDLKISINEHGAMLENENEATQVTWNNIAYINYVKDKEEVVEQVEQLAQTEQPKQQKVNSKKPTNFRDI